MFKNIHDRTLYTTKELNMPVDGKKSKQFHKRTVLWSENKKSEMFALNILYWIYCKGIHIGLLKYIILICINPCIEVDAQIHTCTDSIYVCLYLDSQAFIYCSKTIVFSHYLRGKTIN